MLACGGLPTGGGGTAPVPNPPPAPPPPPPPPPAPKDPLALFAALDPNEVVPYEKAVLTCPAQHMTIRNPSGGKVRVYCATGNGTRSGPYTEWQGKWLAAVGANAEGQLDGRFTRWGRKDEAVRKIGEENYVKGQLEGDFATWDVDGNLLVRGAYQAGNKHGKFVESTVADGQTTFGGACYDAGAEQWRTTDPEEFVSKACEPGQGA